MDISHRKEAILAQIVALHTDSGDPIGSHLLQEFLREVRVSTATLRNEMAQLTALGLLEQPHTSAGRVPTELGYRYYLNHLMDARPLTAQERKTIQQEVARMDSDPVRAAEYAAESLAGLSGLGAIASTPTTTEAQIGYFDLLQVGKFNVAVLGITNLGSLQSRICRLDKELNTSELSLLKQALNETLRFVSSEDIPGDLAQQIAEKTWLSQKTVEAVVEAVTQMLTRAKNVQVFRAGQRNLLRFAELQNHVDEVVRLFEDTQGMARLLSSEGTVECYVGQEIGPRYGNLSMVVGRYRVAGGGHGGLAIVGPVRMDYKSLVPRLSAYCNAMSEALVTR